VALKEYQKKRDFEKTPEPKVSQKKKKTKHKKLRFVIQKHAASRLHYDFRLETRDGVLKSWAVPKGISMQTSVKRLAVETEDHPGDYISFEGDIPKGNYGAGKVIVWDTGTYDAGQDIDQQYDKGKIKFVLNGSKARGL
jgi:bifunctional non-homologous end joining protein LigD